MNLSGCILHFKRFVSAQVQPGSTETVQLADSCVAKLNQITANQPGTFLPAQKPSQGNVPITAKQLHLCFNSRLILTGVSWRRGLLRISIQIWVGGGEHWRGRGQGFWERGGKNCGRRDFSWIPQGIHYWIPHWTHQVSKVVIKETFQQMLSFFSGVAQHFNSKILI